MFNRCGFSCLDADSVLRVASDLLAKADVVSPRGKPVKEIIGTRFNVLSPEFCVISNYERKLSIKYLAAELLWYLSKDTSVTEIGKYASLWNRIAENGKVNSNYGYFVFDDDYALNCNDNQFDWVCNKLKQDKDTRQAVINFNSPQHKGSIPTDFVCTLSVQYFIRDDQLISMVNMRSQDLIYGFCYDFPFFSLVHQLLYLKLKKVYPELALGNIIHSVGSLHVYERHFEMIEKINKSLESPLFRVCALSNKFNEVSLDILDDIKNSSNNSAFIKMLESNKNVG